MATKPITNQRTKQEIREEVAQIDKEIPETKEFVQIMEADKEKELQEENPESTEAVETPVEEEKPVAPVEKQEEVPAKPEPKKELPPLEDRYREAGQEAMIQNSRNEKILETIDEATTLPEPTVDELKEYAKQMGSDYEELDTFSQNMLKENFINKRSMGLISNLAAEQKRAKEWVKRIEDFVDQEQTIQTYPELEDKREEFIKYCSKKTHVGADIDLLVAGFMFKQPVKKPSQGSVLLPSGKGGMGHPKATEPAELTEEDAMVYRTKDPRKYEELIRKKKFKITV